MFHPLIRTFAKVLYGSMFFAGVVALASCSPKSSEAGAEKGSSSAQGKQAAGELTKERVASALEACSGLKIPQVTTLFPDGNAASADFVISIDATIQDKGRAQLKKDSSGDWYLVQFRTANDYSVGSMTGINTICGRKLPLNVR